MAKVAILAVVFCLSPAMSDRVAAQAQGTQAGQNAFDFEFGRWRTDLKRRLRPLSGSEEWVSYRGTTVVTPLIGGRANVAELSVSGPAGRIEGVSLRLFDPATGRWTLNYASVANGALTPPVTGAFRDGRGEFYADDTLGERPIKVRFVIRDVTATSAVFEQAFSADGGKTWEVNWLARDTRIER